MEGVGTWSIPTEMIENQPYLDWAEQNLIGEPVSLRIMTKSISPDSDSAIAFVIPFGSPFPATIGQKANFHPKSWGEQVKKDYWDSKLSLHGKVTPFRVMQPEVIGLAAAFILPP